MADLLKSPNGRRFMEFYYPQATTQAELLAEIKKSMFLNGVPSQFQLHIHVTFGPRFPQKLHEVQKRLRQVEGMTTLEDVRDEKMQAGMRTIPVAFVHAVLDRLKSEEGAAKVCLARGVS